MKLKELESRLQALETFEEPKIQLEQYQTSPHLAARILFSAQQSYGSFEGKQVLDLGCGSGIFTLGPILLGADFVMGVDLDRDALDICRRNVNLVCGDEEEEEEENDEREASGSKEDSSNATTSCGVNYDLLQANVLEDDTFARFHKSFDTVVMNPPFGTKQQKGVDMLFLRRALELATDCVYSLHKTSTRNHIERKCHEWAVEMEVLAELRFDLPKTYKFHKKASVDVEVDFIRFAFS